MDRRTFFGSMLAAAAAGVVEAPDARATVPKMKITRVRDYSPETQFSFQSI